MRASLRLAFLHLRTSSGLAIGAFLLSCAFANGVVAQTWQPLGPPGGDVRALSVDPQHGERIYLGTPDGHIFGSQNAGNTWKLLGRVSSRPDSVVTAIFVDSRNSLTMFAAAWSRDPSVPSDGGIFRSDDGGITWRPSGLSGQAVRALAQSTSNRDVLVAGALDGVFESRDFGVNWLRISPESNAELRNIDSIAIDPRNPEIIYAGTFHLPWKTSNGGRTWSSVHSGMIDDSDVMSILVDRTRPARVFASACSGIYRSTDGGALWQKVQGIPFSARRTHVLAQDSNRAAVIYAGTTEGLWKSEDTGATWRRVTPASWVINSVELPANHRNRVVIGTDQMGILVSDDNAANFQLSNDGFNHQQTKALALDVDRPGRVLAVLANGPAPLLVTADGGAKWEPLGKGLQSSKILKVYASPQGWWATLSSGGLMRYDSARALWTREGKLTPGAARQAVAESDKTTIPARVRASASARQARAAADTSFSWVVSDMAFSPTRWFAASEHGLLGSEDRGRTWDVVSLAGVPNLPVSSVSVSPDAKSIWAVSLRGIVLSQDGGMNWTWRDLPLNSGGALHLEIARGQGNEMTFVATAHTGLFISRDGGASWEQAANGLPQVPIADIAIVENVFVASPVTGGLYISNDTGRTWERLPGTIAEGFFSAVAAQPGGASVLGASSDGVYSLALQKPQTSEVHLQGN